MEKMLSCFGVLFLVVSVASDNKCPTRREAHGRDEYPNPMNTSFINVTGRYKLSHVADPDCVIRRSEADYLDNLIERIENATICPCASHYCPENDLRGYRIGVALMLKMKPDKNMPKKTNVNKGLDNGRLFAYTLEQRWEWGHCSEDLVILFALNDSVLYTMTGKETARRLTPQMVGEISMNWRGYFTKGENISVGLAGMIMNYRDVLMNNYTSKLNINEIPRTGAVIGDERSSAGYVSLNTMALIASVFFCFLTTIRNL